jgi:hypothetical protein
MQAFVYQWNTAILCLQEINLQPTHALTICGFTAYNSYHIDSDRANSETAVFTWNIY